ncbi:MULTISPECIES: ATP-binding protein [unclassified Rhodococcus (in: high G+C Gram-positive bacteria)]|uniref:ATP-binding protein n=1 Tax=unclassified Rhodococcus (in: high G+C Gram-positive bacteria) TaxID=192944 RepID=UPI0016396CAD|nr:MULTISPECIES: ATP-binding protein [unclassified Rhodococcus (in: high G+C Gram-positive bacteria)]MBC2644567.1 HAMP domain-containing protein [Rhodococcus sp. 3A]MBC2897744.1 HAMP domain-containing protein [Rhodococcus sp. 4CII]
MRSLPAWARPTLWGLSIRSALTAAAVVAVALAVGALALVFVLDRTLKSALDDAATARAQDITAQLRADPPDDLDSQLLNTDQRIALVQVVDSSGQVVRSSEDEPGSAVTDIRPPVGGQPARVVRVGGADGADLRITAQGARGVDGDYTVVVAATEESVEATLATVGGLLALGGPIIVVVAGGVTYRLVGRSLRSVEHIRTRVAAISSADLSGRVPVPVQRDGIAMLARTMNDMLGRLEAGHAAQRRFVADASHELRSPLTTVTAALELADARPELFDGDLLRHTLLPEARRMHLLVDDLLLLARADERGLPLRVADVDLDDVVDGEVRLVSDTADIVVTATLVPVRIRGDAAQLSRLTRNLLDNAVRYAATTVHAEVSWDGDRARITVSDDGPGIAERDRERVFDRFVRLEDARGRSTGGSGLGLAIVAEIVAAHNGSVRIDISESGGASVVVSLPANGASRA